MGKKHTKKHQPKRQAQRQYLRIGVLAGLTALGIAAMVGLALFNGSAKPNRDMQWYMKAAPVVSAEPSEQSAGEQTATQPAEESHETPIQQVPAEEVAPEGKTPIQEVPAEGETQAQEVPAEGEAPVQQALAEGEAPIQEAPAEGEAPAEEETAAGPEPEGQMAAEPAPEGEAPAEVAVEITPESAEPVPEGPVTLTITAAGDCTFGGQEGAKGRRRFVQCVNEYGYDYFFDSVRSIFESDDFTIVNLEGPLTTVQSPGKKAQFIFKGDPEYVGILTGSSVELCNLANNHTQDYGVDGLKETARVLTDAGIGFCGYTQVYYTTVKGVRIGAMGFTWWQGDRRKIPAAVAEARQNCDLLIVSMHWGTEYEYQQSELQQQLGHAIIDAGADLLIGTHPHVFQGIERYKGKYIVYSLGNFCFAGNANPSDKRCLIFQQAFSFTPGLGLTQAGIMDEGINIIPATISSVEEYNDFQPTVLDAENGAKVLKSLASHSPTLASEETVWMKDNYMAVNGLLPQQDATAEDAAAQDAAQQEAGEDAGAEESADGGTV